MKLKSSIKKLIHGYIPLLTSKISGKNKDNIEYYRYIINNGYNRHLFLFREEYDNKNYPVTLDENNGLYYTTFPDGKRLYFKRGLEPEKIEKMVRILSMEQDGRSAHRYFDNMEEVDGYTFVDCGSAEGFSSLSVIDHASHVYLFECEQGWIEALNATFAPYKDKVTITRKYIGGGENDVNSDTISLDQFFRDKPDDNIFIKMDIEGAEYDAILGSKKILAQRNVKFAICTYHNNDEKTVPPLLRSLRCTFKEQYGYFRHKRRIVVVRGTNKLAL